MKKSILAPILILALLLAVPVGAEIYKYIDENGQKRWTDDLSQVPKAQRAAAQRIESAEPPDDNASTEPETDAPAPTAMEVTADDTETAAAEGSGEVTREALEKEKAELDAQYQQLIDERKQLEQLKAEATGDGNRSDLNQRISAYNSKTEAYETRLNAFNEKINSYNQSIMKKSQPPASE